MYSISVGNSRITSQNRFNSIEDFEIIEILFIFNSHSTWNLAYHVTIFSLLVIRKPLGILLYWAILSNILDRISTIGHSFMIDCRCCSRLVENTGKIGPADRSCQRHRLYCKASRLKTCAWLVVSQWICHHSNDLSDGTPEKMSFFFLDLFWFCFLLLFCRPCSPVWFVGITSIMVDADNQPKRSSFQVIPGSNKKYLDSAKLKNYRRTVMWNFHWWEYKKGIINEREWKKCEKSSDCQKWLIESNITVCRMRIECVWTYIRCD